MDSGTFVSSFRNETSRIRNLSTECRKAGIFLEDLPEELERIRDLVHAGRMDAALERVRVIKLDLLARLLLQGSDDVLPAEVENQPAKVLPPEVSVSKINEPADREAPLPRAKPLH